MKNWKYIFIHGGFSCVIVSFRGGVCPLWMLVPARPIFRCELLLSGEGMSVMFFFCSTKLQTYSVSWEFWQSIPGEVCEKGNVHNIHPEQRRHVWAREMINLIFFHHISNLFVIMMSIYGSYMLALSSLTRWTQMWYGCFLKWWYPQNTPNDHFYIVGKPMVVGYHHFRKHPYIAWRFSAWIPMFNHQTPPPHQTRHPQTCRSFSRRTSSLGYSGKSTLEEVIFCSPISLGTLPETNSSPLKNGWWEYYFPIGEAYCSSDKHPGNPRLASWWLNQPIWKVWSSNWKSSPQVSRGNWNNFWVATTNQLGYQSKISPTGPPGRYQKDISPTVYEGISFFVGVSSQGMWAKSLNQGYDKRNIQDKHCDDDHGTWGNTHAHKF